ncbi:MAG TPA: prenyltransferase/squalene oxidase repeat-containing protein, partial [Thermoleophilaceae bacterium]|nr:prenyltransferase/squalene oxidase repeat-containing protein [Thermoleophilaceae bacterium]
PPLVRALRRYRRRFEVRWAPAGAEMPAAVRARARRTSALFVGLAVLAAASLAGSPPARAASPTDYLLSAQNCDGGFGAKRRDGSSNPVYTGPAALGLAAAGHNPLDVRRCGPSVIDYLERTAGSVRSTGDLERTILVLRAAGLPPRLGGRDLERELLKARGPDGSFGTVNWTAFGVLAMRAVDSSDSLIRESADSLVECQNDDRGFGLTCGGEQSEVQYTAAVLQAMRAARGGHEATTREAVAYLADAQLGNGGFGQRLGSSRANTQATAWAAQGLEAAGAESRAERGRRYLRSQQAPDGCIRSPTSTPVWATGDALVALSGKYLPLDPVRRRGRAPRPPLHDGSECGEESETPPASTQRPRPADDDDRSRRRGDGPRPKELAHGGGGGPGTGAGKGAGPGSGDGTGSGRGAGPGGGAGPASDAGGDAAGPPTAGAQGSAEGETSPRAPDTGLAPARHLAGAAATGAGLSAGTAQSPLAWRAFSDSGPLPLAKAGAPSPRSGGASDRGPGSLPGLLVVGVAAAALFAGTAGAARLRRLWAVIRRRTA